MPKYLLLPTSQRVVPARTKRERYVYGIAIGVGIAAVIVGAADLSARMVHSMGEDAAFNAFAPAAALDIENSQNQPAATAGERIKIPMIGLDVLVGQFSATANGVKVFVDWGKELPGLAGLSVGDYITVTNGKTEVFVIKNIIIDPVRGVPEAVVTNAATGSLVLISATRDTAVVAIPAYR